MNSEYLIAAAVFLLLMLGMLIKFLKNTKGQPRLPLLGRNISGALALIHATMIPAAPLFAILFMLLFGGLAAFCHWWLLKAVLKSPQSPAPAPE